MRNSSILISGIRGLSNEICKNLVLAGVGSITIIDHNVVTKEDLGAQFLITEQDVGKNRALASADRVRHLNPRVVVNTDTNEIREKPEEFFTNYDLICLTDSDLDTMDEPEVDRIMKCEEYVSLETALSKNDWSQIPEKKLKKVSYVLWGVLILWKFQQEEKRLPASNDDDIRKLKSLRDSLLTSNGIRVSTVTDEFLEMLSLNAQAELSPVCAIMGGLLAQDILNALSRRELPINNLFIYNGHIGK
ncbi:7770_t:CDS:2 [Funneliformis geosporum]|uniref:438_t:CDS:1 n=1 Tax=Funneliformis geosporum TaxID=1117311 RepID=A0A9W4SQX2_9GLOM|nr:7770_t:CDS:2 [Funneliformis geosporum]CAI2177304.1 438_t:CDS:2 [Funneliformis geosporum]